MRLIVHALFRTTETLNVGTETNLFGSIAGITNNTWDSGCNVFVTIGSLL